MTNKSEPSKRIIWNVYKITGKDIFLGAIEAPDEATAIERGAAEFKVAANGLMAIRR
jgi:hypothetical protein